MSKSIFTAEYTVFRELLRELRVSKGLTQDQLSARLGMPQSYVSKYETGERRVDMIEVRSICKSMDTNIVEFSSVMELRLAVLNGEGKA